MYTVELPCKPGSDCWYVDPETFEVACEKGGIAGFEIRGETIYALDTAWNPMEIHSEWCCLTREEAEMFREKLLSTK